MYQLIWIYLTILVCSLMQNGLTGHHCSETSFGDKCYLSCNCIDNKCDENGTCIGASCKSGWSGPTCQKRNIALHSKGISQSPIATRGVSYAIDGNNATYSETFGDRPYLYLDYGQPTRFTLIYVKYIETGTRLNLCLTNDIRDIENRTTFLQNKIRCYDLWSASLSFRYPPVFRYIVLHLDFDQPTAMLVSEIAAQKNNLVSAIAKTKPPSSDFPTRLAIDRSTSSFAVSLGPDSKLMVNAGRFCRFTQIESKLGMRYNESYDMYLSNSTNIFDGKEDGLYIKFSKIGGWRSSIRWKVTMDTPITAKYITFIKRGRAKLKIYDVTALEVVYPKEAKQSKPQFPYKASFAVDGYNTTFSQTFGMNPYISLDLGNTTVISSVEIDTEIKDQDYEFCISNRSEPVHAIASNDSCWNTTHLNSTLEIQTPGRGRYISLKTQGETFLTLNELKVFACSAGTYGRDCTLQCKNCLNHRCDGITGRCIEGCATELMGIYCTVKCPKHCICNGSREKCDSCENGWFGDMCSKYCPSVCSDGCDQLSGSCTKCKPGLYGKYCNETCPEKCKNGSNCSRDSGYCFECNFGLHGNYCDKQCPETCNQSVCDIETGLCVECNEGYFGNNCSSKCPDNCNNLGCKKNTGDCRACKLGFAGIRCNVKCNESSELCKSCSIDAECDIYCPNGCNDSSCNKTTGKCLTCKQNFHGDLCDLMCEEHCGNNSCYQNGTCINCTTGFYGESCLKPCPEHCRGGSCDKRTGYCFLCVSGFFGNSCNNRCPDNCGNDRCDKETLNCYSCKQGFYGKTCNVSCSKHCDLRGCDIDFGFCFGCKSGYYGQVCEKQCPNNCDLNWCDISDGKCFGCKSSFYGSQCEKECPSSCDFKGCSKDAGICYDCKDNYFGVKCQKRCSDQCIDNRCERLMGTCSRCKGSFYGNQCNQKCPTNCKNEECEANSGHCASCKQGFFGNFCNKLCPEHCNTQGCNIKQGECNGCKNGYYGKQCNFNCPVNCNTNQCLQLTGKCFECLRGYYGIHCENACPKKCDRSGCDVNNGECFRCVDGYYGNKCQMDCQKPCNNSACQSGKKFCTARFGEKSKKSAQSDIAIDYSRILIPTICTLITCTLLIAAAIITGIMCTKKNHTGRLNKKLFGQKMDNVNFDSSNFDFRNPESEERL